MSETECYTCDRTIDVQQDEWWSHSWEEHPDSETVDEAIEAEDDGLEFRDWIKRNYILCPDCHARVRELIGVDE